MNEILESFALPCHDQNADWHINLEMFAQLIINECAKIASDFSMNKHKIHPDLEWDEMNAPAQFAAHATAQLIAYEIRMKFV